MTVTMAHLPLLAALALLPLGVIPASRPAPLVYRTADPAPPPMPPRLPCWPLSGFDHSLRTA